jgi:hypothetical protein
MFTFSTLFQNPFTYRVTDAELKRFAVAHLGLLLADTQFVGLAGPTDEALSGYSAALTEEEFLAGRSKAATREREASREEFLGVLGQHEGAIRSRYGKDSFTYVRFFPSGVSHFRETSLDELDGKIGGFERVLREFQHELPAEVVAAFLGQPKAESGTGSPSAPAGHVHDPLPEGAGAIARFRHARSAQLGCQGLLAEARAQVALKRAELENRLYKNLLHAVAAVQDQPEHRRIAAQRLFPQHHFGDYLRNNRRRAGAEEAETESETSNAQDQGQQAEAETARGSADREAAQTSAPQATSDSNAAALAS